MRPETKGTVTIVDTFRGYFKEVIYGGIDGIVTTFAVVAGFAGAALSSEATTQLSFLVVLLFGLANLFADAASMGLGNFLSVRSEKDLYESIRSSETKIIQADRVAAVAKTKQLLIEKGFADDRARQLSTLYAENEDYWLDFMMANSRDLSDPRGENEVYTGLATFISFMVFGAVPLLPFMLDLSGDAREIFMYSVVGTFGALMLLGVLKWKVVGGRLRSSLTEVILVGGTAAVLAYLVGTFFAA